LRNKNAKSKARTQRRDDSPLRSFFFPSRAFRCALILTVVFLVNIGLAQEYAHFQLYLDLNVASAERAIEIYQGLSGQPSEAARERGSQLALLVTAGLSGRRLETRDLEQTLADVKFNQDVGDDLFQVRPARANVAALKDLLLELRRRNFAQKVVSTVEQLFPADARVQARIPMYVVAFGHNNIDAYVLRVRWEGNTPRAAPENEGELTIVINLAKAVKYGRETDERFVWLLSVVAHEVFHAAYGVYKETAPEWRDYYGVKRSPFENLLDLAQNEGVAYYLSLIQRSHGHLPADGLQRAQRAFNRFNAVASELLSPSTPPARASALIRESNTNEYWDSFGSITGMIIARQIDQTLGRGALVEALRGTPREFFVTYANLMRRDNGLPALSAEVINNLR
jgi:hypothetical protein